MLKLLQSGLAFLDAFEFESDAERRAETTKVVSLIESLLLFDELDRDSPKCAATTSAT